MTRACRSGKHRKVLLLAIILLIPLGLFLLHEVQSGPDCHSKPSDVCPCGLISLTALAALSLPLLNGHIRISPLSSPYVVALHLLDPPPELALLS